MGKPGAVTSHLSLVDYEKGWTGKTVQIPTVNRLEWDGKYFGGVNHNPQTNETTFYLLDSAGSLKEQLVIYRQPVHYPDWLWIASGDGFGVVTQRQNNDLQRSITQVYIHVVCK